MPTTHDEDHPLVGTTSHVHRDGDDHLHRRDGYRRTLLPAQAALVTHFIWFIAFVIVVAETDTATCTGTLYNFGRIARWVLLAFFVWDFISMASIRYFSERATPDWMKWVNMLYMILAIAFWIYSIVAIANHSGCEGQALTRLVWIWVILYFILPCLALGCLCCGVTWFGWALACCLI